MSWDGMLSPRPCIECGNPLGSVHPAELYAGTYTGLCYSCTEKGVRVERTWTDGARLMCYPPHLPSWRRNREHYLAYLECSFCSGKGMKIISRSDAQGGSFPSFCKECSNKFWKEHPNELINIFCHSHEV